MHLHFEKTVFLGNPVIDQQRSDGIFYQLIILIVHYFSFFKFIKLRTAKPFLQIIYKMYY